MNLKDVFKDLEIISQSHDDGHLYLSVDEILAVIDAHQGKMRVMLDPGAYMPERAHEQDAGYDLRTPERRVILPGWSITVDTGVHVQIPEGFVGFLKSKSGLNVRNDITGTGTIDSGYTGSITVKLYNHGAQPHVFDAGDKIIQIVFLPIYTPELVQVDRLEDTERGASGFGSTGR